MSERQPLKFSVSYRRVSSLEPYQSHALEINSEFYHDQISLAEARKQIASMVREGLLDELAREHEFTLQAESNWAKLNAASHDASNQAPTHIQPPPQNTQPQSPLWHPGKKDPDAMWAYADDPRIRDLAQHVRKSSYQKAQLSGFRYRLSITPSGREFLWRHPIQQEDPQ